MCFTFTQLSDLAKNYTVIAPDLRGLGDSSKPLTGYDGKTVAEDIHQLVTQLGFKTIFLAGHDIGSLFSSAGEFYQMKISAKQIFFLSF